MALSRFPTWVCSASRSSPPSSTLRSAPSWPSAAAVWTSTARPAFPSRPWARPCPSTGGSSTKPWQLTSCRRYRRSSSSRNTWTSVFRLSSETFDRCKFSLAKGLILSGHFYRKLLQSYIANACRNHQKSFVIVKSWNILKIMTFTIISWIFFLSFKFNLYHELNRLTLIGKHNWFLPFISFLSP